MVRRSLGLWIVLSSAGCTLFTDVDNLGSGSTSAAATVGSGGQGGDPTATTSANTTVGSGGSAGSNGGAACAPQGYHELRLNELAPEGEPDWIEIKNCGAEPVELCGVMLVEEFDGSMPSAASSYVLEDGVLAPGGFLMLVRYQNFQFGLSKDNDQRFSLVSPTLEAIDEASWPESVLPFAPAETWSRTQDCTGAFAKTTPTPGSSN
jgi:hypothetical protein